MLPQTGHKAEVSDYFSPMQAPITTVLPEQDPVKLLAGKNSAMASCGIVQVTLHCAYCCTSSACLQLWPDFMVPKHVLQL